MSAAAEAQFDPVMEKSFSLEPFSDTCFNKQINCALFEQASPYAFFAILAAARLDDDRLDAVQMQEVRKDQTSGSGADYSNLSSHGGEKNGRFRSAKIPMMTRYSLDSGVMPSGSLKLALGSVAHRSGR
jgi:hypothetical protein